MAEPWKPKTNPWLIALTVTLATFMEVLDTSIANVSLPHIAGDLSAGVDESTWVLTSYLVANAVILPLSGWLSSMLGRKNYYMISVAIFTVSSFLSGLAPSLTWLVIFRVLQGLGGGGLAPSEQAILADTFPREKIGMAMALYGFAVVTAPIVGPTLGGWITDNFNWRWIFFINIPVGIISLFLTSRLVEDPPGLKRREWKTLHMDWTGLTLIALGLACLQIALDKGQRLNWFDSTPIAICIVSSLSALVFAGVWEYYHPDPIVEVRLLLERNFFLSNILMFMLGVILFGSTVLLPLFLQTLMGYSATTSGLVLSPGGFVTLLCMPIVGILVSKVPAKWLVAFGLIMCGSSLVMMSHFSLQIDYRTAVIARMVQASGLAFLFVPINATAYSFVSHEKHTQASGLINLSRNVGGAVGIAIATTIISRAAQTHQAILAAHMTPYDPQYQQALQTISKNLLAHGVNAAEAARMAPGLLYAQLIRQSTMLAYVTDFRLMAGTCFCTLILALLLKSRKPGGAVPVH